MASIIPNFEYDIFISYRHNDNKQGGITEFVELLKAELSANIKEPLSIYFDSNANDGLLENHHVDKSLEGKLKCLIFIPIISRTYCDTKSFAWQHEFCAFNKLAKEDAFGRDIKLANGNVASRILSIKIHDLDAEDKALIENEIDGVLRAIEFIYKEPGVNRPLKVSDKKEDNQNHTDYTNQLNKVANAIKEIISAIKNPNQKISQPATSNYQPTTKAQSSGKKGFVMAVAAVLIAVCGFFAYQKFSTGTPEPETRNVEPIDKSIAVLPFTDLSPNKDQEYFSDGLSEELLNLLAKIPDLKVIARTSSFAFKGKNEDLRVIGEKLGVAHILEGSVRKSGNKLRITAQLIKTEDGTHLWSETYDRTLDDIFKVQDEISAAVVGQLKLRLLQNNTQQVASTNPEAYSLFLEGKYFEALNNQEGSLKAFEKYQQALALDSTFAPAWVSLSNAYTRLANFGNLSFKEGHAKAHQAVDKALRLAPKLAGAYAAKAAIAMNFDWDFAKADALIKKALELDPRDAMTLSNAATLATKFCRNEESIVYYKQAIALNPLRAVDYSNLSLTYFNMGQLNEAEAAIRKCLELTPTGSLSYFMLSKIQLLQGKPEAALESIQKETDEGWRIDGLPLVYFKLNQKKEADAALKTMIEKDADEAAFQIAEVYGYRNEKDKAFEWLERAYEQRDGGLSEMKCSPMLKNLYSDPRWLPFLKKMKLE